VAHPTPPRVVHDNPESFEGHVAAMFARYERGLVALIPTIEEPGDPDPDLSLKRMRFRVEALAGFVVGAAIGATARAGRRGPGEEGRGRIGLLLGRIVGDGSPAVAVSEIGSPTRFPRGSIGPLPDAPDPPLVRSISQPRLSAIHAEITRTAHAWLPDFAGALDQLTAAEAPALAFFDQLASRWQHYTAEVSDLQITRLLRPKQRESEKKLRPS